MAKETKTQLMAEITKLLGVTPEEIAKINEDFAELASDCAGTTTEDMIRACKVYDPASFILGGMLSITMFELVQNVYTQKLAERDRLEGNFRDVI